VKLKTVQNKLSDMARRTPRPFVMDAEKARKGAARRYHGIHQRDDMDVPDRSRNDGGNDGNNQDNVSHLRPRPFLAPTGTDAIPDFVEV
jgi:hypothetical protein